MHWNVYIALSNNTRRLTNGSLRLNINQRICYALCSHYLFILQPLRLIKSDFRSSKIDDLLQLWDLEMVLIEFKLCTSILATHSMQLYNRNNNGEGRHRFPNSIS